MKPSNAGMWILSFLDRFVESGDFRMTVLTRLSSLGECSRMPLTGLHAGFRSMNLIPLKTAKNPKRGLFRRPGRSQSESSTPRQYSALLFHALAVK
ncbi:MAG: hypothetical protein ABSF34_20540, partial [Verrucomicrobiota bacterium]